MQMITNACHIRLRYSPILQVGRSLRPHHDSAPAGDVCVLALKNSALEGEPER